MADPQKSKALRTRVVSSKPQPEKKKSTVAVSLRIPAPMLKEIDKAVRARPYKIPRHSWLLEAVHEKLARLKTNGTASGMSSTSQSQRV